MEIDLPTSWTFTVIVNIHRPVVFDIVLSIQKKFSELIATNAVKFVYSIQTALKEIVLLLTIVYSSSVLYSLPSQFELLELWNQLYLTFLSIFQISGRTDPGKFHEMYMERELDYLMKAFFSLTEKICRQHDQPCRIPGQIWKMYTSLIPSQSYLLLQSFHNVAGQTFEGDFTLNLADFSKIQSWIDTKTLCPASIRFVARLISRCQLDLQEDGPIYPLLRVQVYFLANLGELEDGKWVLFETICSSILNDERFSNLSASDLESIIKELPDKWFGEIEGILNIKSDNISSLSAVLHFLMKLVATTTVEQEEKHKLIVNYFMNILKKQVLPEFTKDPLIQQSRSFHEESLGLVVTDLLRLVEREWGDGSIAYLISELLFISNQISRSEKCHARIRGGFLAAIKATEIPLLYLDNVCTSASGPEQMALDCEACITRHLEKHPHGTSWKSIQETFLIPELDESIFIRHCISHSNIYSLFCYSLFRLDLAGNNDEKKVMVGEQIGVWIETLQLDASSTPNAQKVLLLLFRFFEILSLEMQSLSKLDHSRLLPHLQPIQEALFRFSNPPSPTLWSVLGFSNHQALSAELRLICRFFATFLATRTLEEEASRGKLENSFEEFLISPELKSVSPDIILLLKSNLCNVSLTLGQLHLVAFHIASLMFPDVSSLYNKIV